MVKGILLVEQQAVEKCELRVNAMAEYDVAKLVGQDYREARFIGKNIDQAATQYDGVADGERFEGRRHQHAATNFGFDVEIVCDFKIIYDSLENFIDAPAGGHDPKLLHSVQNVIFSLVVPHALRLQR